MQENFIVRQHDTKTLIWWYNRRYEIDLEPPYQRRGKLWSDTDKAFLIDSIINGYDVPKLYLADFTYRDSNLNKKKLPYAIIDGKQRLEAIFGFFDGDFVLNDEFVYLKNPKLKIGGLGYPDLQKNYKSIAEKFENESLSVMSVIADDEGPINELFLRLNRSKPLTGAEVRNAMAGPAPRLIRQIAKHEFFKNNVRFSVKRGQDLNATAKILMFEFTKKPSNTKKRDLDKFVNNVGDRRAKLELSGRHVVDFLDQMSEIFLPRDKLLTSAGIIPVYYWTIRNINEKHYPLFRSFLHRFDLFRKELRNISLKAVRDDEYARELIQFNIYNRSTDDQKSHNERFNILMNFFSRWLKTGKILVSD